MKIRTLFLFCSLAILIQDGFAADEIHWTITGQTSVTFDWRGTSAEKTIVYGTSPGVYTNGVGRDQASNYFNGVIDDLRLYNSALSATDILNVYNN